MPRRPLRRPCRAGPTPTRPPNRKPSRPARSSCPAAPCPAGTKRAVRRRPAADGRVPCRRLPTRLDTVWARVAPGPPGPTAHGRRSRAGPPCPRPRLEHVERTEHQPRNPSLDQNPVARRRNRHRATTRCQCESRRRRPRPSRPQRCFGEIGDSTMVHGKPQAVEGVAVIDEAQHCRPQVQTTLTPGYCGSVVPLPEGEESFSLRTKLHGTRTATAALP